MSKRLLKEAVYPIISRCLSTLEKLDEGQNLDFATERNVFRSLLAQAVMSRHDRLDLSAPLLWSGVGTDTFLGVRYALTCWIDEIFTAHSRWGEIWNEKKLEVELFGQNDRAWRFWEQANIAEQLPDETAIEAFYICVMLGFRGDLRSNSQELSLWTQKQRERLGVVGKTTYRSVCDIPVDSQSSIPLTGQRHFDSMVKWAITSAAIAIPVLIYFIVFRMGG